MPECHVFSFARVSVVSAVTPGMSVVSTASDHSVSSFSALSLGAAYVATTCDSGGSSSSSMRLVLSVDFVGLQWTCIIVLCDLFSPSSRSGR